MEYGEIRRLSNVKLKKILLSATATSEDHKPIDDVSSLIVINYDLLLCEFLESEFSEH